MTVRSATSPGTPDDSISELQIHCLAALAQKIRDANLRHCTEILRRALQSDAVSSEEQKESLIALLYISGLRSYQWARARGLSDENAQDAQQEIAIRLIKRFQKPYDVLGFERYLGFLRITVTRVLVDLYRYETKAPRRRADQRFDSKAVVHMGSLDNLLESIGFEPADVAKTDDIDNQMRFDRCCELLNDPITRQVFILRFRHGATPDEIRKQLNLTQNQVNQRIYHSIRQLALIKEVQEMFESF